MHRGIHFAIAVAFLFAAAPAGAAGGEEGGLGTLLWQTANLVLLLVVLVIVARKPVAQFFAERREGIQSDLDGASQLLKEAEVRHSQWQRKLADLEGELDEIRAVARQRAEDERAKILEDARAQADRIKTDAAAAVDQELRRARQELHAEASQLAVDLAADLLQNEVSDADRTRLVDDFIGDVERTGRSDS